MLSISRLAWMLLVLALVGAVAGLFGPHERVWGVDLGATGTVVFGFALWVGAWLFATASGCNLSTPSGRSPSAGRGRGCCS